MKDYNGQIVEDIKWSLFDERDFEHGLRFVRWSGDEKSFIVADQNGDEYKVVVTK